jgi:hypothetical protein
MCGQYVRSATCELRLRSPWVFTDAYRIPMQQGRAGTGGLPPVANPSKRRRQHATRRRVVARYARMVSTSQVRGGTRLGERGPLLNARASSARNRIAEHAVGAGSMPSSLPGNPRVGSNPSVLPHADTRRRGTHRYDKPRWMIVCARIPDTASPIKAALPAGLNRA